MEIVTLKVQSATAISCHCAVWLSMPLSMALQARSPCRPCFSNFGFVSGDPNLVCASPGRKSWLSRSVEPGDLFVSALMESEMFEQVKPVAAETSRVDS